MSGANLTPLLLRVRDAGVRLCVWEDDGALATKPSSKLTPEMRSELLEHKAELIQLLTWRESDAHKLIKDALAYFSEFYLEADSPEDCELSDMLAPEEQINDAFHERDMFTLRIVVREWVEAGPHPSRRQL